MQRFLFFFLPFAFLAFSGCGESPMSTENGTELSARDSLLTELQVIAESEVLPGFAVSVFTTDSILFQQGFGYADLEEKTPYTVDHVQIIASISKTFTGLALMRAVSDSLLSLDDDINSILPFQVINPHFPDEVITVRMLASHTSSISDPDNSDEGYRFSSPLKADDFPEVYAEMLPYYNHTEDISLAEFVERKLSPEGLWYTNEAFLPEQPGTTYEYSNLAVALLGYLIEVRTGIPFDQYTRERILEPINMHASTWDWKTIPNNRRVTYYNEIYKEVPPYSIVSYPDGGLYSSIADLTRYTQEMMSGLAGKSDLLSQAEFKEMMRQQFEGEELTEGLCWDLSFDGLIGHGGNDFGTATLMFFSPTTGVGHIIFTNITIETEAQEDAFYGAFNTLFEYDLRP